MPEPIDPPPGDLAASPGLRFLVRGLWVAVAVLVVLYLGDQGAAFFYQGF